jgi:hypothetical protein
LNDIRRRTEEVIPLQRSKKRPKQFSNFHQFSLVFLQTFQHEFQLHPNHFLFKTSKTSENLILTDTPFFSSLPLRHDSNINLSFSSAHKTVNCRRTEKAFEQWSRAGNLEAGRVNENGTRRKKFIKNIVFHNKAIFIFIFWSGWLHCWRQSDRK